MSDATAYDLNSSLFFFFFNDTATTEIYTLSLHDALPISVAQLGRGVPHGAAVPAVSRRRRSHRHDSRGRAGGGLELSHLPEPHPRDGAGARREGAGHVARRPERRRQRQAHRGGAAPREAVRALAARSTPLERRRVSQGLAPIGTILPIGPGGGTLGAHALQKVVRRLRGQPCHGSSNRLSA